ncbi:MAG: VOC family protein [Acidimicrobiales bacterium]
MSSELGVTHLRHISLRTSAFDESIEYYQGPWGLDVVDTGDGVAALRGTGSEHHSLRLTAADENGLDHLSFAMPSAKAIDLGAQALADRGIVLTAEPGDLNGPGGGYGFEIADPEGRPVQFSTTVEAVPPRPLGQTPTKIAHVVLNTVDIDAAQAWWCDVLGFRVSDWSEHQMVFLRCNADHHSIAFNQADKTSVNHVAYEVPSLDAFMTSLGRLNHAGHRPGWGPGRHGPGNNAFAYFVDPAGMVPEVTAEVQQIDETTWVPRVWRRVPELSDLWGTAGPPSEDIRSHMAG